MTHRTSVLQVLQFSLLARVSDCSKLKACDLAFVELEGTPAIEVTFRSMKNDPRHNGSVSHIVADNTGFSGYNVVKSYLNTYGFLTMDTGIIDESFLICRSQLGGGGKLR